VGESLLGLGLLADTRSYVEIAQSYESPRKGIEHAPAAAYPLRPMNREINGLTAEGREELCALVHKFSDGEGIHRTAIDGVQCIKLSEPHMQLPSVYQPSICVIVQGAKQVLLENEIYRYAPPQFLAVSVDLPLVGQVLQADSAKPYLCLAIDIDARTIADLISQSGDLSWSRAETSRGLFVGEVDETLQESVLRLARLLETPRDVAVLAPLMLRELHYRILTGGYGRAIAQLALPGSNTHKIGQIIRRIKAKLAEPLSVEELASLANMSPSSFHQHFKAVTAMSPLQYQKRLRLTEARHILLAEKADAASTAYRVGYQSVSQFSREYARMFGAPPKRDVEGIRHVAGAAG
jgi:AraC-like DNA-binding protein